MQRARSGAASRGVDGRPPPLRQRTRRGGGGRLRPASPYRGAAAEHRGELLRRRAAAERQMLDAASECERLDRMLSDDDVSSHGRRERDSDFLGRGRPGGSMAVAIEQQQQQQALAYDEDNSAVQRRRSSQYSAAAGSGLSSSSSSGGGTGSSSTEPLVRRKSTGRSVCVRPTRRGVTVARRWCPIKSLAQRMRLRPRATSACGSREETGGAKISSPLQS